MLVILLGGGGEKRTLRIAAQYADHWNVWGGPEVLGRKGRILEEHYTAVGRDPAQITRSANMPLLITTKSYRGSLSASVLPASSSTSITITQGSRHGVANACRPFWVLRPRRFVRVLTRPPSVLTRTLLPHRVGHQPGWQGSWPFPKPHPEARWRYAPSKAQCGPRWRCHSTDHAVQATLGLRDSSRFAPYTGRCHPASQPRRPRESPALLAPDRRHGLSCPRLVRLRPRLPV